MVGSSLIPTEEENWLNLKVQSDYSTWLWKALRHSQKNQSVLVLTFIFIGLDQGAQLKSLGEPFYIFTNKGVAYGCKMAAQKWSASAKPFWKVSEGKAGGRHASLYSTASVTCNHWEIKRSFALSLTLLSEPEMLMKAHPSWFLCICRCWEIEECRGMLKRS